MLPFKCPEFFGRRGIRTVNELQGFPLELRRAVFIADVYLTWRFCHGFLECSQGFVGRLVTIYLGLFWTGHEVNHFVASALLGSLGLLLELMHNVEISAMHPKPPRRFLASTYLTALQKRRHWQTALCEAESDICVQFVAAMTGQSRP